MGVCVLERWLHDAVEARNPSPGNNGSGDNGSGDNGSGDNGSGDPASINEDSQHHLEMAGKGSMSTAPGDRRFSGSPTGSLESRQGAG